MASWQRPVARDQPTISIFPCLGRALFLSLLLICRVYTLRPVLLLLTCCQLARGPHLFYLCGFFVGFDFFCWRRAILILVPLDVLHAYSCLLFQSFQLVILRRVHEFNLHIFACRNVDGLRDECVGAVFQMLADGRLLSVCGQALIALADAGAKAVMSRVTMVPNFLHERHTTIAGIKSMSVSWLGKLSLQSYYVLNGSGKRAQLTGR